MPSSVTLSDGAVVTPGTSPDTVPVVKHNVGSQVAAIDSGKMDGWQHIAGCHATQNYACISGYQPQQVPNLTTLARQFAISDHTTLSSPGDPEEASECRMTYWSR